MHNFVFNYLQNHAFIIFFLNRCIFKFYFQIGLSGVFTKELEAALLLNHVDIVVHSMKDCPALLPDGLAIGTVFK